MPKFDPEGSDYDYDTAKAGGLGPTGTGENKGVLDTEMGY